MRCLINMVLLFAGAVPAYADIPANREGDNTILLITGIVVVVMIVVIWKIKQSRKK